MPRDRDTDDTDSEPRSMTDRDQPADDHGPSTATHSATHRKEETIEYGERGDLTRSSLEQEIDTHTGSIKRKIKSVDVCECGYTITDPDDGYICCSCDHLACEDCKVKIKKKKYCPDCTEKEFDLSRELYYALHLIDIGLKTPEGLVDRRTVDTPLDGIRIDTVTDEILRRGLVRTEHTPASAAAVSDDERLTPEGDKLLGIAEDLYKDDPGVEEFKQKAREQLAIQRGR